MEGHTFSGGMRQRFSAAQTLLGDPKIVIVNEPTLDYCTSNFGTYPIIFAEVSSFTQGFAGTAYPGVVFMTEHMTFNANIGDEENKDVINELVGHEVAHFWWRTNQIAPDYREGYAMLTESLAMHTEMMICKKMYIKNKMMERVAIHQQIYNAEKGLYENSALIT